MKKLKLIASCVTSYITYILLLINLGNIVYDIVQKNENVKVLQLQKLEWLSMKTRKAELGMNF